MSQDERFSITGYFCSTVGRKQMMAIAGLGLCGFVLVHAAGNMLLFKSAQAYNLYSHALVTNPLIYLAEAGLLGLFLIHIVFGLGLTIRNYASRPVTYAKMASGEKSTSLVTKTMWMQGLVILIFVVLHLVTFKFGTEYDVVYDNVKMRDLFRLVQEVFQSPLYVGWYIFSVTMLTFHLSHGFYSALQTLGLQHPKYTPATKVFSVLYGIFIGAMFISQPLYMLFFFKG
jgi:succinate dehydrogenase / fumarate reductase, cytochrome b subunit